MTISTTTSRVTYAGDGLTTSFFVPFSFFAADEIDVIERSVESGAETLMTLTTHYTVAGGIGATGTVTAVIAPGATKRWTIARRTKRTQMIDYTPNDPFPAETHERALDRLTALVQELDDKLGRSVALSPTTNVSGLTLPDPGADKLLGWKADLSGLENKDLPGGTTIYANTAETRLGLVSTESVTPAGLASLWRKGADIPSANILERPSDSFLGGYHVVTGNTPVTALWPSEPAGTEVELRFSAALLLTHHATSFILPGGVNVTTAPGDVARFRSEGASNWRCVSAPPGWFGGSNPGWTLRVIVKNASYTASVDDLGCEIQFNSGGTTLNLPQAAIVANGATLAIRNAAPNGSVTVDPHDTETLDGLATRALRPGDSIVVRCDGASWRTITGAYSFESAEQSIALATVIVAAHGLGEIPNMVRAVFRCKVTEGGWAVGDEVDYCSVLWSYGGALQTDATNIRATINQTYYGNMVNKSTGVGFLMTGSSWKLVFRAQCMKG